MHDTVIAVRAMCIPSERFCSPPRRCIGNHKLAIRPKTATAINDAPVTRSARARPVDAQTPSPKASSNASYASASGSTSDREGAPIALSSLIDCEA